jgi:chemotaxis protein histidine kinase CheA
MPGKHDYQVVHPPNLLKAKLGGEVAHDPAAVARAEAALDELKGEYGARVRDDVAALVASLEAAKADPCEAAAHLEAMRFRAHDVKGQAGTFGYPLVTAIAGSLESLLQRVDRSDQRHLDLIQTHLQAMTVVVREGIEGEGGANGRELCQRLQTAVAGLIG